MFASARGMKLATKGGGLGRSPTSDTVSLTCYLDAVLGA